VSTPSTSRTRSRIGSSFARIWGGIRLGMEGWYHCIPGEEDDQNPSRTALTRAREYSLDSSSMASL
jgi:hypothetical protein